MSVIFPVLVSTSTCRIVKLSFIDVHVYVASHQLDAKFFKFKCNKKCSQSTSWIKIPGNIILWSQSWIWSMWPFAQTSKIGPRKKQIKIFWPLCLGPIFGNFLTFFRANFQVTLGLKKSHEIRKTRFESNKNRHFWWRDSSFRRRAFNLQSSNSAETLIKSIFGRWQKLIGSLALLDLCRGLEISPNEC